MPKLATINIPKVFLDKYLITAKPLYITVYLYAYKYAAEGESCPTAVEISKALSIEIEAVDKAVTYWEGQGLVTCDFTGIKFISPQSKEFSTTEVAKIVQTDEDLKNLYQAVETSLCKMLSTSDIQKLCWIHNFLCLPSDVICLIVNLAVERGKPRIVYIEKIAVEWANDGINTLDKALEYLENEEKRKSYMIKLKTALGVVGREFTKSEKELATQWCDQLKPPLELVEYAYDLNIQSKGKFSMKYINAILKNWHDEGVISVEQAQKKREERFTQKTVAELDLKVTAFSDFEQRENGDEDDLEMRILQRRINKTKEQNI